MNKPVKEWGNGIPAYHETDLLQGLEFQEFCANLVGEILQKEGYTIEGLFVQQEPVQVLAIKQNQYYNIIVVGDLYPHCGKLSDKTKFEFARFCKENHRIPLFASVGLMSHDLERAQAGLALKYDGYYVNYTGCEDLSFLAEENEKPLQ